MNDVQDYRDYAVISIHAPWEMLQVTLARMDKSLGHVVRTRISNGSTSMRIGYLAGQGNPKRFTKVVHKGYVWVVPSEYVKDLSY